MFKRLDPHEIIVEHYKTFNDNNTGKLAESVILCK